jgi:signal transduction histidine kinase
MKTFVRGAPLFAQVLGLVVLSMVLVHVVLATLIATVPPPPPEVYRLSDVVRALQTDGVVEVENARPLVSSIRKQPPNEAPPRRGRWRDDFRQQLARSLNVGVDDIVIETQGGPRRMMMQSLTGEFRSVPGPPKPPGWRPAPDPRMVGGPGQPPAVDGVQVNVVGVTIKRQIGGGRPPEMRVWNERVVFAPFKVGLRQADGSWRVVQPRPTLRLGSWQLHILLTIALSTLIVAPVAWLFARRLSAPIALFAEAAERLGRDPRAAPLEVAGSREVAAATEAFNRMQERLRRYVEDRTAMVGAIAHDLRTPLTRLRFRIEAAPEELRGKLAAETGSDATALPSDRLVVEGDPVALRRLVGNLVENALKYGQRVRGRVFAEDGCAIVEIEDDGPGVMTEEIERLFEPFYRGEPSRSRETGGAGLGLAVVRSIARGHGGDVTLRNRTQGGLTARVSLPL